MKIVSKVACALLFILGQEAVAQDITLMTNDGLLTIEGKLISFDGTMLNVDTSYGEVNIPAADVTCSGACPDGVAATVSNSILTVAFKDQKLRRVFESLLNDQSVAGNAQATVVIENGLAALASANTSSETAELTFLGADTNGDLTFDLGNPVHVSANANLINSGKIENATAFEVGIQPLAIVASPTTGIEAISFNELAAVFSGQIKNWSELGGNDVAIQPFAPVSESGVMKTLEAGVLEPLGLSASPDVLRVRDNRNAVLIASAAPGGITIVPLGGINPEIAIPVRNACNVPVRPSPFTIGTGTYPLVVSAYAAMNKAQTSGLVPRVLDAIASGAARSILLNEGYSDQSIVRSSEADNGARLANVMARNWTEAQKPAARELANLLLNSKQLSLRFHSSDLKAGAAHARANFVRLAEAIERGDYDGQELVFVGYAPGNDETSISGSYDASATVLEAFRKFSSAATGRPNVRLSSSGLGSVGIACSASEPRETAEYVEVWVRPMP